MSGLGFSDVLCLISLTGKANSLSEPKQHYMPTKAVSVTGG
jgi:hypothetical protein